MNNRPGWYYTQDGRLRYRDESGWTEHYLDFDKVRTMQGPPPPPQTMLEQVLARQAELTAQGSRRSRRRKWRPRRRH